MQSVWGSKPHILSFIRGLVLRGLGINKSNSGIRRINWTEWEPCAIISVSGGNSILRVPGAPPLKCTPGILFKEKL